MPTCDPHLEKLLEYCALAPNIEKYCEREKKKHPIIGAVPLVLVYGPLFISVLAILGSLRFPAFFWSFVGLSFLSLTGFPLWNRWKMLDTRKKLGYSFGLEDYPSQERKYAILEKLLCLPATPQTQELKSQLWEWASKNFLPMSWWNDVEKEIDAWVASHERDVLKAKLLEPDVLETISVVVKPALTTQGSSMHRVEL